MKSFSAMTTFGHAWDRRSLISSFWFSYGRDREVFGVYIG